MLFSEILFAIALALVFAGIVGLGLGWRHPRSGDALVISLVFLFFVFTLTFWVALAWFPLVVPRGGGIWWLNILLLGFSLSLLIMSLASPSKRPREKSRAAVQTADEAKTATVFGVFFWILVTVLLIAGAMSHF